MLLLVALRVAGCSTGSNTLARPDLGERQVIYRISEKQASTIALDAYAKLLPKQRVDDVVDSHRRGYSADQRFALDWYIHRVLVIPAVGRDRRGYEVRGYWFDISGSGSMPISGAAKHKELVRFIEDALAATGTAITVTDLRDGSYETDGRAFMGLKREAQDIKTQWSNQSASTADRLHELKALRESGLINEDEYQLKRRELLDRM